MGGIVVHIYMLNMLCIKSACTFRVPVINVCSVDICHSHICETKKMLLRCFDEHGMDYNQYSPSF